MIAAQAAIIVVDAVPFVHHSTRKKEEIVVEKFRYCENILTFFVFLSIIKLTTIKPAMAKLNKIAYDPIQYYKYTNLPILIFNWNEPKQTNQSNAFLHFMFPF